MIYARFSVCDSFSHDAAHRSELFSRMRHTLEDCMIAGNRLNLPAVFVVRL